MPHTNILIGGEAGQGLATVGQLLSRTLVRSGYHILVRQDYESRVRGGHNMFAVRTGVEPVKAPCDQVDLLLALNQQTADLHAGEMTGQGLLLLDKELDPGDARHLAIPFKDLAPKAIFHNVVGLGVLAALLGLDKAGPEELLRGTFAKKGDEIVNQNLAVLDDAYAWVGEQGADFPSLPDSGGPAKRLMMQSNEAIALGAMAAGASFCSFYPMTPSTSVAMNLINKGSELGVVVEQVEDEIAAVNMALGASWAGGRSIVSTSGGGFALMVEGVSLAGVAEVPVVIVVAQRPGPATGLATRTEQGELNMVLSAGHGEFPRAVFAPWSMEDFFHLTHKAFDLAERVQGPVFVLTDQYGADSLRSVEPFDLDALPEVARPDLSDDGTEDYKRYAMTDSGVSPRRIPGLGKSLSVADSHEHTEDGRMSEDPDNRTAMNDKRLRKQRILDEAVVPPDYIGDDEPELLLVCWGSTRGAAEEAVDSMRADGRKAAVLHFKQVWPLDGGQFADRLEAAGKVVCVEGNATAQLAGLLRRETGFAVHDTVLKYDGRPFTSDYILSALDAA